MFFADRRSLLYYKHVEETLFAASTEASSCLTYHNTVLLFPNIFSKPVVARFDQRQDSSEKLHVTLNKDPSLAAIADARGTWYPGIQNDAKQWTSNHPRRIMECSSLCRAVRISTAAEEYSRTPHLACGARDMPVSDCRSCRTGVKGHLSDSRFSVMIY